MLDTGRRLRDLQAHDLHGLAPEALAALAQQMLRHIGEQGRQLGVCEQQIAERDRAIKFKDARIERITFELARLKAWKFGAKTEAMSAEQRQLSEETLAEDQASLEAQLQALQGESNPSAAPAGDTRRKPRRQALPEHLERVEHRHEPDNTTCPSPDCGRPMVRIGEDARSTRRTSLPNGRAR